MEIKVYRVARIEAPKAEPATGRYSTAKRKVRIVDVNGVTVELVLFGEDASKLLVRTTGVPA